MSILSISVLILLGILLILLEMLVIPGKIFTGILGIILIVGGVSGAYSVYGKTIGHLTLTITLITIAGVIVFALRTGTWNRLMLKTQINSSVADTKIKNSITKGDTGIAVSRLAPMGKVLINDNYYEAKANNTFIDQNSEIEVIKVNLNNIIVKLKNT